MRFSRSLLAAGALALALPAATLTPLRAQDSAAVSPDTTRKKPSKKPLPLEPARTFSLTAHEGSWLSLDVSPDGRTLVFDYLGDLYTLPMAGGTATRITHGMAFDGQPRFSPDGSTIVFTSDRDGGENLWLLTLATGDTTQLTKGKAFRYQSPEWTPDGAYIVAGRAGFRTGAVKLYLFHKDGGSGIQLIKEPDNLKTTGPAFGPDGRYIWYEERTGDWQYNAIFPQYQLARYDRETGQRYSESSRFGSGFRPTVSPDGQWLVYGTRYEAATGLRLRNLATGDERWLAYPVQRDDQESRATRDTYPGMSFTPDAKALVASYGGRIWRIPLDGSTPQEIPFTVTAELELGPELAFSYPVSDSAEFTVRQIRDAVPSPDGKQLAFVALDRLYVMDYPGGTPRRLTTADVVEAEPTWSPDGQWLAYVTWEGTGGNLDKVRANGRGAPVRLTATPAVYQQPAWSPDGARIVFLHGPARAYLEATGPFAAGSATEIAWVPATGGEVTRIAPTEGRDTPHFTADPSRIYLHHNRNGLVSIRFDGTDEKAHVKVTGVKPPDSKTPPSASLILMAPKGDQALAQLGMDLYLVTVPLVGGDTPTISVADPDKAAFPARRLTDIGGQFPAWGADGRTVHWSIGNAHVVYQLDAAAAAEKAAAQAKKARPDSAKADSAGGEKAPAYTPAETRVTIRARRDMPSGTVVLRGARAITMRGDEVIENADIVVRNNRLVSVGSRGAVPEGARVIDLSGKTIVPGFVDTHAHLRPAWGLHRPDAWAYWANLAFGVTTTRDPQTGTTDVLSYGDLVEAGEIPGPRIYSTGPGVFWNEQFRDLDHVRRVLKRYSEYYDTKTIKMYVAGNRQQRQWIIMAAREQRLMPTTEGSLNLKQNLTQIIDGYPGHEHSFPIFPLYQDVVKLVAFSGVTYTPTMLVAYGGPWAENYYYATERPHDNAKLRHFTPHQELDRKTRRRGQGTGPGPGGWFMDEEYVFRQQGKVLADIVAAGGHAGVGSHGQLQGLGYHWELWSVGSGGLSNHQALRVATMDGARAIGLSQDLGSLEPGKLADLVVLDGNPLDDLRQSNSIRYVMKNGRLYEGDTLSEVWPRAVTRSAPAWWDDAPGAAAGMH